MKKDMGGKFAYSISEVVELGPLRRTRIYEEIANGNLVARKSGRRTFILAADFEQFLLSLPLANVARRGPKRDE